MNSAIVGNSKIQAAMELSTLHPDYEQLPESVKLVHTPQQYLWLGEERLRVIDRECQPDYDVTE